ncbi:MAG: sigma-70 family RNA polymerase sigma factor [Oscillatoria sp. SIO1A7]|nr:sigma-70 family RNA polymerase sigma factor [Oscillatoria sp. SIO1A7]
MDNSGKLNRETISKIGGDLLLSNTAYGTGTKIKYQSIHKNELGDEEIILVAKTTEKKAKIRQEVSISITGTGGDLEIEDRVLLKKISLGDAPTFWKLWVRHKDYLYGCCLEWMKGNPWEAEEALSEAMLKAWDKLPKYAEKITNIKGWLARLTHNLCMDIHRERKRGAKRVESIEAIADREGTSYSFESPDAAILRREMAAYIRQGIESLSPRLRAPFMLRFCQDKSYQAIAKQMGVSEHNIRKRIQQARAIMQEQLNQYLSGSDDSAALLKEIALDCGDSYAIPLSEAIGGDSSVDYTLPWSRGVEEDMSQEPQSEETEIFDEELGNEGCIMERINYRVTASCLETVPHTWFALMGSLSWR